MYEVMVEESFSAAHQLRGYKGECESLHGHTWKIQVVVRTEELDKLGLSIDFRRLKDVLRELIAQFDHSFLNQLPMFQQQNPSSENLARFIYEKLEGEPERGKVNLVKVIVWESPTTCAAYFKEQKTSISP